MEQYDLSIIIYTKNAIEAIKILEKYFRIVLPSIEIIVFLDNSLLIEQETVTSFVCSARSPSVKSWRIYQESTSIYKGNYVARCTFSAKAKWILLQDKPMETFCSFTLLCELNNLSGVQAVLFDSKIKSKIKKQRIIRPNDISGLLLEKSFLLQKNFSLFGQNYQGVSSITHFLLNHKNITKVIYNEGSFILYQNPKKENDRIWHLGSTNFKLLRISFKKISYLNKTHALILNRILLQQINLDDNILHEKKKSILYNLRAEMLKASGVNNGGENNWPVFEKEVYWDSTNGLLDKLAWKLPEGTQCYIALLNEMCNILENNLSRYISKYIYCRMRLLLLPILMKPIKIVFFAQEFSVWPSLRSVYEACAVDPAYDAQLVHVYFNNADKIEQNELEPYLQSGYSIIDSNEYNLSTENPDIAVFVKPYDMVPVGFNLREVAPIVSRLVYIPYGMQTGNSEEMLKYKFKLPLHAHAWIHLSYSKTHTALAQKHSSNHGTNIYTLAHPRLDIDYASILQLPYTQELLQKAAKRKIVFWNTHFNINTSDGWGSFLQWYPEVFAEFAKVSQEVFIVWRPHPHFFSHLNEALEKNEINKLVDNLPTICENCTLDVYNSYLPVFAVADAMISDITTLIYEFLATGKPILYTPKFGGQDFSDPSLKDELYIAETSVSFFDFLQNVVVNEQDIMKENRMQNIENYIVQQSSKITAGEQIANIMKQKLEKECQDFSILYDPI